MAEMLRVAGAAGRLGVSVRTVYALVGAGKLPCYRVGVGRGAIRFGEGHLTDFLAGAERGHAPAAVAAPAPRMEPLRRKHLRVR